MKKTETRLKKLRQRFLGRVVVEKSGCWTWLGRLDKDGYGIWDLRNVNGRRESRAARLALILFAGGIEDGYEPHHLCKNKRCVNPAHLEPVTPFENNSILRRRDNGTEYSVDKNPFNRERCIHGHPWVDENRGHLRNADGRIVTYCRVCKKELRRKARRANSLGKGKAASKK